MSKLIRTKQALDQAVTALFEHAPFLYPLYELTGPLPLRHHKPGFIGRFAGLLGEASVNIATFALGRDGKGGSAIALVEVDGEVPAGVLRAIQALPGVKQAKALKF